MNRYTYKLGSTYCYHNKKDLITDLCEALQRNKKEYIEKCKTQYHPNPYWLSKHMELNDGVNLECWHFSIFISDVFEVKKCSVKFDVPLREVKYCCNPDCNGKIDNVFHNITEFRSFLNREIGKETWK